MITSNLMLTGEPSDAQLVAETLSGDREAFAGIIDRYKSLICSLAYSATGSLSESEDVAQDTFLVAWKQLSALREPEKLRPWLCGIARNITARTLQNRRRQPACEAESLERAKQESGGGPLPLDKVISDEEEAILWRSLESIPERYREPLILYYREHRSIHQVAAALDLNEEAVRQRLSRGRRLLQEQVLAFVEGALERSVPGKTFTVCVLATLPLSSSSAAGMAAGTTLIQKGAAAKSASSISLLSSIAGSFMVLLGTYIGYRASRDAASSQEERDVLRRFYRGLFALIGFFSLLSVPLMIVGKNLVETRPVLFSVLLVGLIATYAASLAAISVALHHAGRRLTHAGASKPMREFQTNLRLLGLPLIHLRMGGDLQQRREPVKAWLAFGEVAMGGLFAFGGVAVAPIAVGGLSIGVLSWGGSALGLLAVGGFSLGWWSFGGCAVGCLAFGGWALGWQAAVGALALARDNALGWVAYAAQFNDLAAGSFISELWFFRLGTIFWRYGAWLNLCWILPLIIWWHLEKRAGQRKRIG